MAMEIQNNVHGAGLVKKMGGAAGKAQAKPRPVLEEKKVRKKPEKKIDIPLKQLETISSVTNKRLKFSINKELGQVIVKVIDGNTDKVIKELPPEELQRLHLRIREAVALLIDETI